MRRKHYIGFSLVELLASIAVIGLLASILIPAVNSVREMGQKAQCASNLRQLGAATLMFCNDNGGQFPKTTHDYDTEESWIFTLAPYVEDVDDIRISPGDPLADDRLEYGGTSYVMNEYTAVVRQGYVFSQGWVVFEDFTNIMSLPNPTKTVIVFTGADDLSATVFSDHIHSRSWTSYHAAATEIQPDRHRGGANYLYADGHVGYITSDELEAKFSAGINIAEPPQS